MLASRWQAMAVSSALKWQAIYKQRVTSLITAVFPISRPSLGGVESLIEQPALVSFYELTTEQRLAVGIKDNLVRFAIGIEDAEDIIADLKQALDAIPDRELEQTWEQRFRA
jgi:cystathionine beta-lyase/cystathionine gamma-synthase